MNRGDRLAFSNGIIALGALAAILLVIYQAELSRIINLYVVGVFTSFTLSQLGMVQHWRRSRETASRDGGGTRSSTGSARRRRSSSCCIVLCDEVHPRRLHRRDRHPVPRLDPDADQQALHAGRRAAPRSVTPPDAGRRRTTSSCSSGSRAKRRGARSGTRSGSGRTTSTPCTSPRRATRAGSRRNGHARSVCSRRRPMLEIRPSEGGLAASTRAYIQRMRKRIPAEDFVTVIVSERVGRGIFNLGTRTGLAAQALAALHAGRRRHQRPATSRGRRPRSTRATSMRHVVVVAVPAAHNATLRALSTRRRSRHGRDPCGARRARPAEDRASTCPSGTSSGRVSRSSAWTRRTATSRANSSSTSGRSPPTAARIVTVLLPEFVVRKWWHHILHNQNAFEIKLAFLSEPNVIVTSVPYHLDVERLPVRLARRRAVRGLDVALEGPEVGGPRLELHAHTVVLVDGRHDAAGIVQARDQRALAVRDQRLDLDWLGSRSPSARARAALRRPHRSRPRSRPRRGTVARSRARSLVVEQVELVEREEPRDLRRADLAEHLVHGGDVDVRFRMRRIDHVDKRSALATCSSVDWNASTRPCGSLRMKPTVSVTTTGRGSRAGAGARWDRAS